MNTQPDSKGIGKVLVQLHDQLEQAQAEGLSENDQALLRHLMDDIQQALLRAESRPVAQSGLPDEEDSVLERLQTAITELEVSHPMLSAMIRKAIDTLDIAGI